MPILEFKCKKCDVTFEDIQTKSTDVDPDECPECGSKRVKKVEVPSGTAFKLNGGGWGDEGYASNQWRTQDSGEVRIGNPKFD